MNKSKYIIGLFLSFSSVAYAQKDLPSEEVKVVKEFDARLLESKQIVIPGMLPKDDNLYFEYEYEVQTFKPKLEYLPPVIRPIAANTEEEPKAYNVWLRAGAGLPKAFNIEGEANIINNENLKVNAFAKHLSMDNSNRNDNQKAALNSYGLEGTHFLRDEAAVSAHLSYDINSFRWYGLNETVPVLDDFSALHRFNKLQPGIKIYNAFDTDRKIDYSATFDFYRFADNQATRESGADLLFSAGKRFDDNSKLYFDLDIELSTLRDTQTQQLNNFSFGGGYKMELGASRLKLGASIASNNDNFSLFPQVEALIQVSSPLFIYGGAEGGLQKNNFLALGEYNPFIAPIFGAINNNKYYHFFVGSKAKLDQFQLDASIGYQTNSNLALFVTNMENPRTFNVLYDTVQTTYLKASLTAEPTKGMSLYAYARQNIFSLNSQDKAWGLPTFEAGLHSSYKMIENKLLIKVQLDLLGNIHQLTFDGTKEKSNLMMDFTLGGNYYITENIGVFLDLNNILNNRFRRWYDTPTFGINFIAGASVRF